jgi:hypothetical protein
MKCRIINDEVGQANEKQELRSMRMESGIWN